MAHFTEIYVQVFHKSPELISQPTWSSLVLPVTKISKGRQLKPSHWRHRSIPRTKPLKRQAQALWFSSWFSWAFLSAQRIKDVFGFWQHQDLRSKTSKVVIYRRNYANFQTLAAYYWRSCSEIIISQNSCQNSSCHYTFYKNKLPGCPEKTVQTLYKSYQLNMNFTAAALKFRTEHVWDEESG